MSKTRTTLFQQLQDEGSKVSSELSSWRSSRILRYVILILTPTIAALFLPSIAYTVLRSGNGFVAIKGQTWQNENIVAQSSFAIRKSEERYRQEVAEAEAASPIVFRPRATQGLRYDIIRDEILRTTNSLPASPALKIRLVQLLQTVSTKQFINRTKASLEHRTVAILSQPTVLESSALSSLADSSDIQVIIEQQLHDVLRADQIPQVAEEILRVVQPKLEYWAEKTEAVRSAAADNVPHSSGIIRKGEVVVHHGDLLDEETLARLSSYGVVRDESPSHSRTLTVILGALLHAFLVYSLFVLFVYFLRKKIINDNMRLLSLSSFVILSAFMAWLSLRFPASYSAEYSY